MTFDHHANEAFVWIWLPGETEPVVAGKLQKRQDRFLFNYGKGYLERARAISLYEPELPLQAGILPLPDNLSMPGCLRDGSPDAWGRRIIINKLLGKKGSHIETGQLDELTYLLESGSDRIGALDFQCSPTIYEPRAANNPSLEELLDSADRVEKGIPLTPELDKALFLGSSIGGARPKALIENQGKKYVAKFSSSTDLFSVVKAEYLAMRLGSLAGLTVAPVTLVKAAHKDVLLVERFDRKAVHKGWERKTMVSALTLFGLDEMMARCASYETFAEIIRSRFSDPTANLRELFSRLVFNILCGNTDDHARNHAAFWDGKQLRLTPAYDICPQGRAGNEASQAMLISGTNNLSQIKTCLDVSHLFLLSREAALKIYQDQRTIIEKHWNAICDEAELSEVDRNTLWGRQFLNPFALESLDS